MCRVPPWFSHHLTSLSIRTLCLDCSEKLCDDSNLSGFPHLSTLAFPAASTWKGTCGLLLSLHPLIMWSHFLDCHCSDSWHFLQLLATLDHALPWALIPTPCSVPPALPQAQQGVDSTGLVCILLVPIEERHKINTWWITNNWNNNITWSNLSLLYYGVIWLTDISLRNNC